MNPPTISAASPSPCTQRMFALAVVGWCVFYGCFSSVYQQPEDKDQFVFRRAVEMMRDGQGYYAAMNTALNQMYGPAESMRAFRFPTLFVVWSWLPTTEAIWWVYLGLVAITGLLMLKLTKQPAVPLIVVIYLTTTAVPRDEGGWLMQYTTCELWLVPIITATLWAWRNERQGWAAFFACLAFLARETTLGLLVGGLVVALVYRRAAWPWAVGLCLAAIMLIYHYLNVSPLLVPTGQGRETQLYGTGGLKAITWMTGYWLPHGKIVGPIIWLLGLTYIVRYARWALPFGVMMILPVTGAVLNRPYWGAMIVPFSLLFAGDLLTEWYCRYVAQRRHTPNPSLANAA